MTWFILSLLTALAVSSHDAWIKKFFSHLNLFEMSSYPLIYSLPLFSISIFFVPVPPLDAVFLWYFILNIPIAGLAFILHIKAIKVSPLSLTLPYLAFTPVFMVFTGYLFLNEMPDRLGGAGIVIICAGSYILNLDMKELSFFTPIKAIFKETGSWLMFIVSILYSLTSVMGKVAIMHSSPLFFSMTFFAVFNILLLICLLMCGKIRLHTFKRTPVKGLIAGVLLFLHILFHGFAISLAKAVYMISIKRLSILFGIIYGGVLFKEKNLVIRFCGALCMFIGAVIITLMGQ